MNARNKVLDRDPTLSEQSKPRKALRLAHAASGLLLLVPVLLACGHHEPKPGTKETVTAYESDGTTVIKFEACEKFGASYNYPACGKLLRDQVSASMCNRGPGTHSWMYQIGSTSPMPQTTYCK